MTRTHIRNRNKQGEKLESTLCGATPTKWDLSRGEAEAASDESLRVRNICTECIDFIGRQI